MRLAEDVDNILDMGAYIASHLRGRTADVSTVDRRAMVV